MIDSILQRLEQEKRVDLLIRVRPHAAQSRLVTMLDDGSLKIDIAAPAEDGRGNAALIEFLAETLNISPSSIRILSGKTARLKLVRIRGFTQQP